MIKKNQTLQAIFLSLLLAGCGFKLRGSVDMPLWLNHVAIILKEGHRDLVPMLKDQFQAYNRVIEANPSNANYLLIIERDSFAQQITSVSASTTPRQYQLIYTVQFSLISKQGAPIISSKTVTVTRQLTVNNDRILGSDSESVMVHAEMRRDAAMQMINRVSRK